MKISTLNLQSAPIGVAELLQAAIAHRTAGRLAEARGLAQRVLAQQPGHPAALNLLGALAHQAGERDLAVHWLRQAIAAKRDEPSYYNNLSLVLFEAGRLEEAALASRQAVVLDPTSADYRTNLARALYKKGELDPAIASFRHALALLLASTAEPATARLQACAYVNLATALADRAELDEAFLCLQKALALDPEAANTHHTLGWILLLQGKLDDAIASTERALALQPGYRLARFHLSMMLLTRGDFARGLAEFEWRPERASVQPELEWDGGDLAGRTLLLPCEQGLGDTIQYSRYLERLATRGSHVIVQCAPELKSLLEASFPDCQFLVEGDRVPKADVYYPLPSLPLVFQTTLETIPARVPYLRPDPSRAQHWRKRLAGDGARLKVGLAWAGNKSHASNRRRSLAFAQLAPLLALPGASFYMLQKGDAAQEASESDLIDFTGELRDLAETAALVENLDLVITVDTSVAHLAGALGKPVWILLPFITDWRWLLDRPDSPWYPTMRLFRQDERRQWRPVVARVVEALSLAIGNPDLLNR